MNAATPTSQGSFDFSGRDIGHIQARIAADNAGIEWRESAMDALREYASGHRQFTVEQVRSAFPHIKAPTDKAWGAIVIQARKAGLIAPCGNVKVQGGRMLATLWMSRLM